VALKFFDSISTSTPKEDIYRRLGYVRESTFLKEEHIQKTDLYIDESAEYIQLKGCACRVGVESIDNGVIKLVNDIIFESKDLAKFLLGSKEVLIMGATAGELIMNKIQSFSQTNDLARGIVYDASASEIVDGALDWILNFSGRAIVREGLVLDHRRFSAGYGDFALKNQKVICEFLQMDKIGVKLTKSFLMLPEKSVTAISGIRINDESN